MHRCVDVHGGLIAQDGPAAHRAARGIRALIRLQNLRHQRQQVHILLRGGGPQRRQVEAPRGCNRQQRQQQQRVRR